MSDRVFYTFAALTAVVLIALASVYPQGQGARSPKPFGHATWASTHPKKTPAENAAAQKAKLKGSL